MRSDLRTVRHAYGLRADDYTRLLGTMDSVHPDDRQLVESWADGVEGRLVDAGCGPGHWTAFLDDLGHDARGIDLTPRFIEIAREAYPNVRFDLESIEEMSDGDAAVGGILAWFSTIHHEPSRVVMPLREFARVLRPGGSLLLGAFAWPALEAFDHAVTFAYRWPVGELHVCLRAVGFDIVRTHRRDDNGERPVMAIECRRRGSTRP